MEKYLWIGFIGAVIALLFAVIQRKKVMSYSEGNATMQKIAKSIREGANAYLKHQYSTVAKVFAVVFVILAIIAFASGGSMLSKFTPFAFLTGGIWSMLAGLIGMKIATNANARTAQAASEGLNRGLRVAFSSGSVMGFTVVGLGMLDISLWLVGLYFLAGITDPVELGNIMVMNGIPKTTPVTPLPSPTTWATTWATWPAWVLTCTSPMSVPSWLPLPWAPAPATAGRA